MPYINQHLREKYTSGLSFLYEGMMKGMTAGELNYVITSITNEFIKENGISYGTFNDVVGVLECVKQELYRRRMAPYEEKKIKENGDLYGMDNLL